MPMGCGFYGLRAQKVGNHSPPVKPLIARQGDAQGRFKKLRDRSADSLVRANRKRVWKIVAQASSTAGFGGVPPPYRGVRRIGDTPELWSAPAKRSGDGALTVPALRAERAKAGSRFACPRTPKLPVPQPNVAHPTVPSVNGRITVRNAWSTRRRGRLRYFVNGPGLTLVRLTGAGGSSGVFEPGFWLCRGGGKGGSPKPGGGGGSLVTSIRQVWRSPGDISFQRSAFFRNCASSSGVMLANLRKEAMQIRRCSGGSFANASKVFSISRRSASEKALSVFSCSWGDNSKKCWNLSHIRWRRCDVSSIQAA